MAFSDFFFPSMNNVEPNTTAHRFDAFYELKTMEIKDDFAIDAALYKKIDDCLALCTAELAHLLSVIKEKKHDLSLVYLRFLNQLDTPTLLAKKTEIETDLALATSRSIKWTKLLLAREEAKAHSYQWGSAWESSTIQDYKAYLAPATVVEKKTGLDTDKLAFDLIEKAKTPVQPSKISAAIGFLNMYRLLYVCEKLCFSALATLPELSKGMPDAHVLVATTDVCYALSVAYFGVRWLNEWLLTFMYVFDQNQVLEEVSLQERFWREVKARHETMVNDTVWLIINFLTNYNVLAHIAAPMASHLLVAFLVFDFMWLAYSLLRSWDDYTYKKQQYRKDALSFLGNVADNEFLSDEIVFQNLQALLDNNDSTLTPQQKSEIRLLLDQVRHQDQAWFTKWNAMLFNLAAALVVVAGFSGALFGGGPIVVALCFFLCTIGVSMYLSSGKWGAYVNEANMASRVLVDDLSSNNDAALDQAWFEFEWSLGMSIAMPVVIVGLFTVCWPAGLSVGLAYFSLEFLKHYYHVEEETSPTPVADNHVDEETNPLLAGVAVPESRSCLESAI